MFFASAEIVRWVAESKRPFQIVNDQGFRSLMKTGRPGYHLPSAETVFRDVKKVFTNVRKHVTRILQVQLVMFADDAAMTHKQLCRNTTAI